MSKRKPRSLVNRAFHSRITHASDAKTGEMLNIEDIRKDWEYVSDLIQRTSIRLFKTNQKELLAQVKEADTKTRTKNGSPVRVQATVLGRSFFDYHDYLGVDYTEHPEFKELLNGSRVNALILASVITACRGTITRQAKYQELFDHNLKKSLGITNTKPRISAGWARTINPEPSGIGKIIDYSIVDNQYCTIIDINNDTITYELVCKDRRIIITCTIPKNHRNADYYTKPKLVWNTRTNEFSCIISAQYLPKKYKLSRKYIIGVDVGIKKYVTYSVLDTENMCVVEQGELSNHHKELYGSCLRTQREIASLWEKIKKLSLQRNVFGFIPVKTQERIDHLYDEICNQREALTRKRREVAIRASLELRDLSVRYGNAVIARENLSWVGNTMQNGRWNCGEFFNRLQDKLEETGGRSIWVSAYKTSQTCSYCVLSGKEAHESRNIILHDDRVMECLDCGSRLDRDENASVNVALGALVYILTKLPPSNEGSPEQGYVPPLGRVSHPSHGDRKGARKRKKCASKVNVEDRARERARSRDKQEPTIHHVRGRFPIPRMRAYLDSLYEKPNYVREVLCNPLTPCYEDSLSSHSVMGRCASSCTSDRENNSGLLGDCKGFVEYSGIMFKNNALTIIT